MNPGEDPRVATPNGTICYCLDYDPGADLNTSHPAGASGCHFEHWQGLRESASSPPGDWETHVGPPAPLPAFHRGIGATSYCCTACGVTTEPCSHLTRSTYADTWCPNCGEKGDPGHHRSGAIFVCFGLDCVDANGCLDCGESLTGRHTDSCRIPAAYERLGLAEVHRDKLVVEDTDFGPRRELIQPTVSDEDRSYREALKSLVDEVDKVLMEDQAGGVLGMSDLRQSMDAFRQAAINWAVSEA